MLSDKSFSAAASPAHVSSVPAATPLVMVLSGAWSKAIKMNGKLSVDINEL